MLVRLPRTRLFTVVFIFICAGALFFRVRHDDVRAVSPSSFFADRYSTLSGVYNPNAKGAGELSSNPTKTSTAVAGAQKTGPAERERPSKALVDFWDYWSVVFDSAKPPVPPIQLTENAKTDRPTDAQKKFGYRQPYESLAKLDRKAVESMRKSHLVVKTKLENMKYRSKDMFHGKGVVIVAGKQFMGPAIIGLRMLRRTGSMLPAEIFVQNAEEYEPKICEETLPKLGAKCKVLTDYLNTTSAREFGEVATDTPEFKLSKYQLKCMALLLSSFEDVLFLDSDSIPLVNPEKELFDTAPFKEKGMIVYPDFWYSTEDPKFYEIAGVDGGYPFKLLPPTSTESGQFLFSKRLHLDSLLLAAYYNIYGPDWFYPLLSQGAAGQGDKETFLAAAAALGKPFHRVQSPVSVVGYFDKGKFEGTGMVQYSVKDDLNAYGPHPTINKTDVKPAFVHQNLPKLNAGALLDDGHLKDSSGRPRRMWGDKKGVVKNFGTDLERDVWEEIVHSGCELEKIMKDWKWRDKVCERLKAHWEALFTKDEGGKPISRGRL